MKTMGTRITRLRPFGGFCAETGETTKMPLLPLMMGSQRLQPRMSLPQIGAQTAAILADIGYPQYEIERFAADRVITTKT